MQIAQVVPNVRTLKEGVFDYAILPEFLPQIRPGILVEVPFHGRKIEGIVINLKLRSQVGLLKANLKSILKIIDPTPVVDEVHIKLAKWMSEYYLAPFGQTLFENVVPPAIRLLKKSHLTPPIYSKPFETKSSSRGKKYLVIADFRTRLNFYLKICQKVLKQNKSVIILVPDLTLIRFFKNRFTTSVVLLHAKMTKTERWLAWQEIRENKAKIILGSQSALFAPVKNLGAIIIDQEENETYKNDRSPRFHAVKVAEKLTKLTTVNLILGSITPRIETYDKAIKNIYTLKKTYPKKQSNATIVNMNGEFQAISSLLQKKIEENLAKHQKIILVLNRKGEGTKFSCQDCRWIFTCQNCGLPLIPQGAEAVCFRCDKISPFPESCPKCQSVHLKPFGLGTNRLEKIVKKIWPALRVVRIEESSTPNSWDIAIVTSYALKFNFPSIGLVGIIDADTALNFPDYRSNEKVFQIFYKFLKIGEEGIIQTNLAENPTIQALAQLDFEKFFTNELSVRQKYGFPPFTCLVRLLYRNEDKEKCQKNTKDIYQCLQTIIEETKNANIALMGPAAAFFKKVRNYYRYQIIIKIQGNASTNPPIGEPLASFLKTLPKGWTVDVDPMDML